MSYFPPYIYSKNKIEVELDLSNLAIKSDLKHATGVDISQCAKKDDLANLKSKVDKLDIAKISELDADKLKPFPVYLSKLSDMIKNDCNKKDVYNAKIKNIEDKIPDIINLASNTTLNGVINEDQNEIPSITNLATNAALTTVENKIPNISDLVKKADYDAKIKDIKNKYFTTSDYNKFANNILN